MTERNLATIQTIKEITPIEGADRIVLATVLGWQVIVQKSEFDVGDRCVFFQIDSVLPSTIPEFAFMEKRNYRVRSMKMRGVLSQGLAMPLTIIPNAVSSYRDGADVTDEIGVTKYELPNSFQRQGGQQPQRKRSAFPTHLVPKTDEERIQNYPGILDEIEDGTPLIITQKLDGTSATFLIDIEPATFLGINWFGRTKVRRIMCSRNIAIEGDDSRMYFDENVYAEMDEKYGILESLEIFSMMAGKSKRFAIQGEIVGPKIQGNPLQLKTRDFFVFNVYDIDERKYLDHSRMVDLCKMARLELKPVPVIKYRIPFDREVMTMDWWLERAKGTYDSGTPQEGIVVRPDTEMRSRTLQGRLSFKVVNNDYLLKKGE